MELNAPTGLLPGTTSSERKVLPPPPAISPLAAERLATKDAERFAHVDDKRVLNETGMVRRRGLFVRLVMWLAFKKVGFDERHQKTIRELERDGEIVYVMNHHSVLDYAFFNYAFIKFGLPLAFVANTITTMLFFRPLWAVLLHGLRRLVGYYTHRLEPHERVAYALARRRAPLVFLKKRHIWPWATAESTDDSFLATVLESQLERVREAQKAGLPLESVRPIRVVPQMVVWEHNPERVRKSFWRQVFGDPDAPSRLRKLINFLLNRHRAFVQIGKPIDLIDFIAKQPDAPDLATLAKKLRSDVHRALSIEERIIKGPVLKRKKQVRTEIMAHPEVQAHIASLAAEINQPTEKVTKEIEGYLKEMAADFSMLTIEMCCIVLTIVFNRIFHEVAVDQVGLERVREAARKTPLVLLPCHRSHIDYLVLSYIFYVNGLIPPHIASGKNLNFFPVGGVFRRSGAFFLRRSFKDNRAYALAFREYLTKLVQEGVWIEFFLEGGRSRTGKMLSPKFGMLKIIVDAIASGAAPDVSFVPIYIGYEHVIEEKSFSRELGGAEKKKENLGALLSATKVLWTKFGRLHVNFGEPISCREALAKFDEHWARMELSGQAQAGRIKNKDDLFLHRLGYRVTDGINKVAVVTPTSLVAAVFLFNEKRGITRETLLARVGMLIELAALKGAKLSQTIEDGLRRHRDSIAAARGELEENGQYELRFALGDRSPLALAKGNAIREACDEVINRFVVVKQVEEHRFESGSGETSKVERVYVAVPESRINLDFYKNNIVHLLVPEAIVATAIRGTMNQGGGSVTNVLKVMEAAAFLSRTFQHEFIFDPEKGFAFQFAETLGRLADGGLIVRDSPDEGGEDFAHVEIRITEAGASTLEILHRVMAPWIEAYWLIADVLSNLSEPMSQSKFIEHAQTLGRRRFQVGDLSCPEAASNVNFQHALSAWEEFGLVEKRKKGRESLLAAVVDPADPERLVALKHRLRAYFP